MTKPNDPAYSVPQDGMGGLTIRELFAAMAMQGLLGKSVFKDVPTIAVEVADALIAELNKEQGV